MLSLNKRYSNSVFNVESETQLSRRGVHANVLKLICKYKLKLVVVSIAVCFVEPSNFSAIIAG